MIQFRNHNVLAKDFKRMLNSMRENLNEKNVKATNDTILSLIAVMDDWVALENSENAKCLCSSTSQSLV